jgi:glycine cleavage system H protein
MSENPSDLRYTKDHEWARSEGNRVRVGITRHAVDQLGDITLVDLKVKVGGRMTEGKDFGTVESVKAVSDLYAPITGTVVEINRALDKTPEQINEDPYNGGWMVLVELDAGTNIDGLMTSQQYDALLGTL